MSAPRLSLLLIAIAVTGCFEPVPAISGNDETAGEAQGTDTTAGTTANGDSGATMTASGDPTFGTTSGGTGDGSSGEPVTTDTPLDDGTSTTDAETSAAADTSTGTQDTEAPRVDSMTPTDGATAVRANATIVLSFSEPMDVLSVADALDTGALDAVTLSWNDDDTELTLTPDDDIPYATGSSPLGVEALEFTVTLSNTASDLAGNTLDEAWTATFSSARRLTVALSHDPGYTGGVISSGVVQTGSGDDAIVGDYSDNLARRGFFGFSIAPLPAGILEFEVAQLRAMQWLVSGNPIPGLGNSVTVAHIAPEPLPGGTYNSAALSTLGVFSDEDTYAADNVKTVDVTANVEFDYDNAQSHTQYRLSMTTPTNFNGTTDRLRYNNEVLEVTYLLP
ncbi:MAG: Ig-like domain-containing protein [Nannocystales bacterium]